MHGIDLGTILIHFIPSAMLPLQRGNLNLVNSPLERGGTSVPGCVGMSKVSTAIFLTQPMTHFSKTQRLGFMQWVDK